MKKRDWINLPNTLTAIRILLVPVFLLAFFNPPANFRALPLCVFFAAGLTDCLDGYIARRFNKITTLGKVIDPSADKLLTAAVVFSLVYSGVIPWMLLAVIVVKELYMACGASICLRRKVEVQADIYGKLATVTFYPAVLLAWPWHGIAWLSKAGQALVYISVAMSVIAAIHYTIASVKKWNEMNAH